MSGSSPTYNYPAQPTYGEGMADAMKAQMEMLTGKTLAEGEGFEELYASALGKEGGNLADIMRKFEAPLRKETAQIDTDVMRQTLLGSEQKTTQDPKTKKWGIAGSEVMKDDAGEALSSSGGRYQIIKTKEETDLAKSSLGYSALKDTGAGYAIIDTQTGGLITVPAEMSGRGSIFNSSAEVSAANLKNISAKFTELQSELKASDGPEAEAELSFTFTNPNIPANPDKAGQAGYDGEGRKLLGEGDTARAGDGMVDLVGDSRAVQEQTQSKDYAQYVKDNPDLQAAFDAKRQAGEDITIEEYGQQHYDKFGKAEGRDLAMGEYSLQDAGRQAGFDQSGKFMGLSALSEDIARGGQQRAREADIADVERLGGRATDAYRAQGDLSGALATARNMGAGGSGGFSAIPKDPLFEGVATNSLAARATAENAKIDAITSGGMTYAKADPAADLKADISYTPSAGVSGGAYGGALGTYDPDGIHVLGGPDGFPKPTLRSDLLADAQTSLTGGLTQREERQISEAMKAQSTMMGRTFDQSAGIAEAKARTLEDRNRQAINRQYAQQVLGQEAGLQESDLGRGLQAQLANQQATNQAAQFGVGAGLQQEQLGAQLDQQTALANQAALQDARRYTAQEAMQAKQMELGRQTAGVERQLTAEEKDIERIMRQQAMEEQYRQQGLGAERANAAQMVGLEQATSADPFQAILQRQGQNNLASGGAVFGQAGYGLDSGPQYLNPESGLGFIQNQATNAANMYNAQVGAGATRSAGMMGGVGSVLSGGLQALGTWGACWVAREVYGAHNPAWLDFRHWMFSSAPKWFFKLYLTFGERFANFISNKPRLKARIRMWMDSKIGR